MTVALLIQALPLYGTAAVLPPNLSGLASPAIPVESQEPAVPISEIESMRTADEKHFRASDGSFLAGSYGQIIHYQDENGDWQEIDNTLVDEGDHYAPKASGVEIALPKALNDKATLANGKFGLEIGVAGGFDQLIVPQAAEQSAPELASEPETEPLTEAVTEAETQAAEEAAPGEAAEAETSAEEAEADETAVVAEEALTPGEAVDAAEEPQAAMSQAAVLDLSGDAAEEDDITTVENLSSGVIYVDAFPGADLQYILQPDKLKQNVIAKYRQAQYAYEFTLDMTNLVAEQQKNGTINLLDAETGELKFRIEAPYAIDAIGEFSKDALSISLNGNILTLTADPAWMNAPSRAYPVVLDPTYVHAIEWTDLDAGSIHSRWGRWGNIVAQLHVGQDKNGDINRSLLHFRLPSLPNSGIITTAGVALGVAEIWPFANSEINIGAYRVLGQWYGDEVTWNSQPAIDEQVLSIGAPEGSHYFFDVTNAMKQWYENGKSNFGIMLKALDERIPGKMRFAAPQGAISSAIYGYFNASPALIVHYVNNVGLENYWTNEPVEMGRTGTAYITHYNGGLTYVHPDVTLTGQRMPLTLAHTYVSSHENFNESVWGMKFGTGFRLNLIEEILPRIPSVDADNNACFDYSLVDGDGTVHYFKGSAAAPATFTNEIDDSVTLTKSGSQFTMSDKLGNTKIYQEGGSPDHYYLTKIQDTNGNATTITYNAAGRITTIMDTVGRPITLQYNPEGYLTSITSPTGEVTRYAYGEPDDNGKTLDVLKKIIYDDGKETYFDYETRQDSNELPAMKLLLALVKSADDLMFKFNYAEVVSSKRTGYRVSGVLMGTAESTTKIITKDELVPVDTGGGAGPLGNWGWIGKVLVELSKLVFWVVSHIVNMKSWAVDKYGRWYRIKDEKDEITGEETEILIEWDELVYTLSFKYNLSKTEITNTLSPETTRVYLFNNWGLSVAATEIYKDSEAGAFANYTGDIGAKNLPTYSADATVTRNLLRNASGEYDDGNWSSGFLGGLLLGTTNMVNDGFAGQRAWQLNNKAKQTQSVTLQPGTYTLSAYSKDGKGRLGYDFKDVQGGVEIELDVSWQRYATTFTLTKKTTGTVYIEAVSDTVLFDALQLEKNGGASSFNYVENSDFTYDSDRWSVTKGTSADKVVKADEGNYYLVNGDPGAQKSLVQEIPLYAAAGQMITFGAKVAANAVGGEFKVLAKFYNGATEVDEESVDFIPDIRNEQQTVAISHPLSADSTTMRLFICYYNQAGGGVMNAMKVSDAFVFVGTGDTTYRYDDGNLTEMATKDGALEVEYDGNDNVTSVQSESIDAYGEPIKSSMEYDYVGTTSLVKSEINFKNGIPVSVTEYEYGSFNLPVSVTVTANGGKIRQEFAYTSDWNNISKAIDSNGLVTEYTYGLGLVNNIVTSVKGPDGSVYQYGYDEYYRLLESVQSGASKNVYSYTDNALLGSLIHGSTVYAFDYNKLGQVKETKIGNTVVSANKYDEQYRLKEAVYGNRMGYRPEYDARGRLTGDYFSDAAGNYQLSYGYVQDNNGNLSQVTNHETQRTTQFMYDLRGQLTGVYTADSGNGKNPSRVRVEYEGSALTLLTEAGPDGVLSKTGYRNDELGRPETVGLLSTNDNDGSMIRYAYSGLDLLQSVTHALPGESRVTTNFAYKTNGAYTTSLIEQLKTTLPGGVAFEYKYDYSGPNISKVTANGVATAYEYGANGQLTKDGGMNYAYDASGNITGISGAETHTFTYGNANWKDQLTIFDDKTLTYDAMGNLTSYSGRTYTWAKGKQLAGFKDGSKNVSYRYEFNGLRGEKTVGNKTTRFNWANGLLMSQTDGTNTIAWNHSSAGYALGFSLNGVPYFYIRNMQGDVVGIYDIAGKVVAEYKYDAWGNILSTTGSDMEVANANPIRYRGYYWDAESGFYYCQSRYYNPEWRRWISADLLCDTATSVLGTNMYTYCNNNPVMYADPSGMCWEAIKSFFVKVGNEIKLAWNDPGAWIDNIWHLTISAGAKGLLKGLSNMALNLFKVVIGNDFPGWLLKTKVIMPIMRSSVSGPLYWLSKYAGNLWGPDWMTRDATAPLNAIVRKVFSWSLNFAVGWAEWGLGFEKSQFRGHDIYTSTPGNVLWQQEVGFIWLYDWVFSVFCPTTKKIYPFTHNGVYYALWLWKADYWNLGPGTEIGIYSTDNPDQAAEGHYYVQPDDLKIKVHMRLYYDGYRVKEELINLEQINWWVCAFAPWVADKEKIMEEKLSVNLSVSFDFVAENDYIDKNGNPQKHVTDPQKCADLWPAFRDEKNYQHDNYGAWPNVILNAPPSGYQFRINY